MKPDTYREHLNDLQLEVEELREKLKEAQTGDTISRQAAIEIINRYNKSHMVINGKPMLGAASIIIELEDLPSAQPEIIRCKDCKWYDLTYPHGTIVPNAFHCEVNDRFYEESHFCGYGERRE